MIEDEANEIVTVTAAGVPKESNDNPFCCLKEEEEMIEDEASRQ
jgi:hypothetical protein